MKTINATGLKGTLHRDLDDTWFFRVYDKTAPEGFKDYRLVHNDLEITINGEAALYEYGMEEYDGILDHSPEVLGLDSNEV
jgi:hypothetical protein